MSSPYGIDPVDSCLECQWRRTGFFCDLDPSVLEALDQITFATVYPSEALLYTEGQSPRGLFMICRGRVKLSSTSVTGKTIITRVANEGEVLGLGNLIRNAPYHETAETLEPSHIKLVREADAMALFAREKTVCLHVVEQLSHELEIAEATVRTLGLSNSASEKLAHLLLSWSSETEAEEDGRFRIPLLMTHQEVGEMIGASRETVTRLLGDLKERGAIEMKGSTLIVNDRSALEKMDTL